MINIIKRTTALNSVIANLNIYRYSKLILARSMKSKFSWKVDWKILFIWIAESKIEESPLSCEIKISNFLLAFACLREIEFYR